MGMCWSGWRSLSILGGCVHRMTMTPRQSVLSYGKPGPLGLMSGKFCGARTPHLAWQQSSIRPWCRPCFSMGARCGSSLQQPWLGWRGSIFELPIAWRSSINRAGDRGISGFIRSRRMCWRSADCAPSGNILIFVGRQLRCMWRPARSSTNVSRV
jgi:hypothetical protein